MAALLAFDLYAAGPGILFYRDQRHVEFTGEFEFTGAKIKTGRQVKISSPDGSFDFTGGYTFSFMVCPLDGYQSPLEITMLDAEGKTFRSRQRVLSDGWFRVTIPLSDISINTGKIISISMPDFVLLDDIRVTPQMIGFEFPPLLPVTASTLFPEYTREQERERCLNDSRYREKMAAIEMLRQANRPVLGKVAESEKVKAAWMEVSPADGSIQGFSFAEIKEREQQSKTNRTDHEGYSLAAFNRLSVMVRQWRDGLIARTPENKRKMLRAFIRYGSYEVNRRGEHGRWVAGSFVGPQVACDLYFTFMDDMEAVEKGGESDPDLVKSNQLTKELALYCCTLPDNWIFGPVLTTECFRNATHWVGGNFGYRPLFMTALICRNPLLLDVLMEVCRQGLDVTSFNTRKSSFWREGITADRAAWGHGEQNYIFGYPRSGISTILKNLLLVKGSLWEQEKDLDRLRNVIDYLEVAQWYCFGIGKYGATLMTPMRIGMRWNSGRGFQSYAVMLEIFDSLDKLLPQNAFTERKRLKSLLDIYHGQKAEFTGCRYFWNNDDLIWRRQDFYIGVNMTSRRTLSNENTPNASSKCDYLADGATFIMNSPETYTTAKGFWLPYAIPGTTTRQAEFSHNDPTWRTYRGRFNFAGGVSGGEYGVCGFHYAKAPNPDSLQPQLYGVTARKSYFFFEDEMVCLGSNIENENPEIPGDIATTIDQTEWLGVAQVSSGNFQPGKNFRTTGSMLAHNGVGYLVLSEGKAVFSGEKRAERWLEYNRNHNIKQKNRPTNADILTLQINHEQAVKNGNYAYIVHRRTKNLDELKKYSAELPIKILAADSKAHAVRHSGLEILQAVVFEPDTVIADGENSWRFSAPVAALIKPHEIIIADPLQNPNLKEVTVRINDQTIKIELPSGKYCGQAATVPW